MALLCIRISELVSFAFSIHVHVYVPFHLLVVEQGSLCNLYIQGNTIPCDNNYMYIIGAKLHTCTCIYITYTCENYIHTKKTNMYNHVLLTLIKQFQQYRAFTISQDTEHDFYDAIPMPCLVFLRHTKSCFLCFFDNPYIPFNSQNF